MVDVSIINASTELVRRKNGPAAFQGPRHAGHFGRLFADLADAEDFGRLFDGRVDGGGQDSEKLSVHIHPIKGLTRRHEGTKRFKALANAIKIHAPRRDGWVNGKNSKTDSALRAFVPSCEILKKAAIKGADGVSVAAIHRPAPLCVFMSSSEIIS